MKKLKYFGYLATILILASSCGNEGTSLPKAETNSDNTAALIIDFGNDSTYTDCFDLGEKGEANGWDFLQSSGIEIVDNGGFACKIGEVGCDLLKCYNCACPDYEAPSCQYWTYWHWVDGEWQFSQVGAGQYTVKPGATECWMWGNQNTPPKMAGYSCK